MFHVFSDTPTDANREILLKTLQSVVRTLANISMNPLAHPNLREVLKLPSELIISLRELNHRAISFEVTRLQVATR